MMTKSLTEMSERERKVFDACYNGWFMSGRYTAEFEGHNRVFFADSVRILWNQVDKWFAEHEEHHAHDHLLVKCVAAL